MTRLCLTCGNRYAIGWRCRSCGDELQETGMTHQYRYDLEHEISAAVRLLPDDLELLLRVKETTVQVCLCPRGKIDRPLAYTHVRNGELSEQVAAAVARLVEVAERAKKTEDAKNAKESK